MIITPIKKFWCCIAILGIYFNSTPVKAQTIYRDTAYTLTNVPDTGQITYIALEYILLKPSGTGSGYHGYKFSARHNVSQELMPGPIVRILQSNVSCYGGCNGTAMVTLTTGYLPYTYSWTPGGQTTSLVTGLCAGTYGCQASDRLHNGEALIITITQPASPVAITMSSHTNATCNGGTGTAIANAATGGTSPYTYSWLPSGGTNLTASNLTAGTYTITATDNNGCTATASVTITQPTAVTITIASHTNALCNSGFGSATANAATGGVSPYTYHWTPSGGTNLIASNLSAGTYTITATDNHGCTGTASVTITQPTAVAITIASHTNALCNGGFGTATANAATGGTSPYTYHWTPSGGTNLTASNLSAGTYTITATDNHGCTGTVSVTISQPVAVSITIASHTNALCNGGFGTATSNAATGGTSPYTYNWTPSGGTNLSASNLSAGTYTITATDNHGCTGTASVTITQPAAALTITIASHTNILCNGGVGTATANAATGGTSPYTYNWTPSGGTNLMASNLSAGTYTITATDNHGCTATASVIITQPAAAVAITIASHTNALCYGGVGTATANAATGGTSPYTYNWTPSGGTNLIASNLSAGTYTITATDNHGCTATASVTITQPATAVAITIASHTNPLCNGGVGTATANAATGGTSPYTYNWTPSGGTNLTASNLSAGTYTITATDNHGCTASASITITQPASAVAITIASHTNPLCNGGVGTATANAATGGTAPYTYNWTPSGGTNLTATNLSAGTYTITATDNHGCTATASVTITQPAVTVAITIASHTNAFCNGGFGTATANAATGGTAPYTYNWTPSGGTNLTASNLSAGTYTITATDNHGCTATASVTITQPATAVTITIASHTNPLCNGGVGTATANAATGGTAPYTYNWTPSGGTNLTASNLSAGTYTITATDNQGCTGSASVTITQPATAVAITIASHTNAHCFGGTGTATANAATGGTSPYTYNWTPSGGTNLTASNLSAGTYTITATDNHGCTATASVTITAPAAALSATFAVNNNACYNQTNGSATITPSNGTTPYTYSWNPSGKTTATATGLSAGTYTATVQDNCGASVTATVTITQSPAIVTTMTNVIGACSGNPDGQATVNVSGGTSPYTYSWTPSGGTSATATGLTGLETYTVIVTDKNGCTASNTAIIIDPAAVVGTPSCSFGTDPTIVTITPTQPAGVTINWDYTDLNGYTYAGTANPTNPIAYLPVWPLNATITFYLDSGTYCQAITSCTYTNTVAIPSTEKPYPRWSKRGMYINWDLHLAQLYMNDAEGINEKNIIVNYCKANHIFYVDIYNLLYNEGWNPVFDNFDQYIYDNNYATSLSEFIYDLKVHGGVEQVGVVSSPQEDPIVVDSLEAILTYNTGKYWNQKVDVISLDEEWTDWGDFSSCTNDKCRYKWTVDHFDSMHCPLLQSAYFTSRQCSHNNIRVEDLISFPLDPYTHGSHIDSSYHLYPYMNMEIDTIGLYADRVLITSYNTDPLDQWNRADWIQIDSGLGRNPFNAYYKKEIWPAFDPANDTTNACVLCHDSFGSANFLGSNMCKHSTTPVTMEQYYFDSVSYSENHNPTPVFTNIDDRGKFCEIPMYSGSGMYPPDTSFQISGCMWFIFDQHSTNTNGCLQNYTFDTMATVTSPATTIPFYVQIGHDTQWVASNPVPITFKAYTQGGTTPYTYTWVNMENGRIVYYSTTSNTYTIYYDDIANNYSVSKLGVVVTDKSSPVNKATDYCCVYQKYTGTPYMTPVGNKKHPPSIPWRDKWRKSKLTDTLESPGVIVYPNPNRGMFTVKVSGENVSNAYIEIYSVLGQRIFNSTLINPKGEDQINLSGASNGIYFYRVLSDSGTLIGTGKLIIEK